ncbi:hypothetical protein BC629DRAFT_1465523 [Irpex lacteus]|nr:hypothetical protein BC629DRAFT_1465518 [Irpex lacteus]KAI0818958.1 hypothetical protein BC629DRAFT_1465523 [Irpex lacteus]
MSSCPGDANFLPVLELDKRHHRHNVARSGFPESHVYALISTSPYIKNKNSKEIDVVIPIGPVQIILQGQADFASLNVDMNVYLKIPFLPQIPMGGFKGNLNDGITISVGVKGILSGSLTLYINEERVLHLRGELEIYTKTYNFDMPLFTIPFASDDLA